MFDINYAFRKKIIAKNKLNKSCRNKIKYGNFFEAKEALKNYTESILFSNMNLYYCKRHECYHLGHDERMEQEVIVERSFANWEKVKLAV